MKAEVVATLQGKLLIYPEEADWLKSVIEAQKSVGSDVHQQMSEHFIKELNKITECPHREIT